jgi:hypothetical protein
MARKDWINVGVSSLLVDAIDSFLKSEGAKITRTTSRQQFVNKLILEFFANYQRKTGIVHLPQPKEQEKIPDLLDLGTKKTKK